MDDVDRLRLLVLAAHRDLDRQLALHLRAAGVTLAQGEALLALEDNGTLAVRDLGDVLVRESGSPSRLARTLVDAGWVQASPEPFDGRVSVLRLTPLGRRACRRARAALRAFRDDLLGDLPTARGECCERLLLSLASGPSGRALRRRLVAEEGRRTRTAAWAAPSPGDHGRRAQPGDARPAAGGPAAPAGEARQVVGSPSATPVEPWSSAPW